MALARYALQEPCHGSSASGFFATISPVKRIFPTPQDAENAFYEALEKSDLDAMMEVWAEDEEIVCVHPGGARLAGYAQVRESWARIFASGQRLKVHLVQPIQMVSGMLAVHSVHESLSVPDDRTSAVAIATNIYARAGDGWRLVVHHASPAEAVAQPRAVEIPQTLH
jgi:ketosteroid isomerase-like protein